MLLLDEDLKSKRVEGFLAAHGSRSDFATAQLPSGMIPVDDSVDGYERFWEIRMAIKPNRENLNRAAQIAANILSKYKLDFKVLALNGEEDISQITWDASQANHKIGFDRHQCGKELCIYMSYDPKLKQYLYTPSEYKFIMLELWKAMQVANVDMGYIVPSIGEKMLDCEEGVTSPFSYSGFKDFKNRYGILLQNHHNPKNLEDPLEGVRFSLQDLLTQEINSDQVHAMNAVRMQYTRAHISESEQGLLKLHDKNLAIALNNHITKLELELSSKLTDVWNKKQKLKEMHGAVVRSLQLAAPRNPKSPGQELCGPALDIIMRLGNIDAFNDKESLENEINLLREACEKLKEFTETESRDIYNDFLQYNLFENYCGENKIFNNINSYKDLEEFIKQDPRGMQSIFVRLIVISHERQALKQHQDLIVYKSFHSEEEDLKTTLRIPTTHQDLKILGIKLINQLRELEQTPENMAKATMILHETNKFIKLVHSPAATKETIKEAAAAYKKLSDQVHGKSSQWKNVVGAMLLITGAALIVAGIIGTAVSLGAASPLSMPVVGTGVALTGTALATTGIGSVAGVFGGLFCFFGRTTGANKTMQNMRKVADQVSLEAESKKTI